MTSDRPAPATSRRRLANVALLAVLCLGSLWGAYVGSESMRPLPFQFILAPLAVAMSIFVALCLLIAGAVAGAFHHLGLRQWLYRAAGLAFAGTTVGTIAALVILAPPSTSL